MCKKVITAAILGGVTVFIWGMISWMVLPWHGPTFNQFSDEITVSQTLNSNAGKSGIYLLPYESEFSIEAKEDFANKYKAGPLAFVAFSKAGGDPTMKSQLLMSFITQLVAALIIAMLLSGASGLSYGCRLFFVTGAGLLTGILGYIPNYVWWHFPLDYTLVGIADQIIAWFIAGLIMAKIIRS